MLKKIFPLFLLFVFGLILVYPVKAQETKKPIYFFFSKSCPHCAREKVFLEKLVSDYPRLEIKFIEVGLNSVNDQLFEKVSQQFGNPGYTPFTVVGEFHFIGFLDEATTGQEIIEAVECYLADDCEDEVQKIANPDGNSKKPDPVIPEKISLPLIGEVGIKNLSLPVLTFLIALLDGFNPCAMWVLLFLISLLLGMENQKRRWGLGLAFILASGAVYFLFLTAWLNLFLFLGLIFWVRLVVGTVALGAGGVHLRDWWRNREGGCRAVGESRRQKIFERIKRVTRTQNFWVALGGILVLAVAVNLIELVCSAGLPAIYTQVLALNQLPTWQYYLYLLFYILVFMLDDLLVFGVAMVSLKAMGIESKYARWSRLVGGILMLLIGLLLLFKPEWLTFA